MIRHPFKYSYRAATVFLALGCLACGYGISRTFAVAQDLESRAPAEQPDKVERLDEIIEQREDDEALEDLFNVRRDLKQKLAQLEADAKHTRRRLELIDQIVSLTRLANKLEEQIEHSEESSDAAKEEELHAKYKRVETQLATYEELIEIEHEIAEFEYALRDADDEEDHHRLLALKFLLTDLRTVRSITTNLLSNPSRPVTKTAKLKEQKTNAQTRIRTAYRALEIVELLNEAEEEEDDEEHIEQLESKLHTLVDELNRTSGKPTAKRVDIASAMQPILVNEQTLAPYATVDLKRDVAPLLRKYCFDCHDNNSSSGALNLERLLSESPIVKNRRHWINVIEQSKIHVMPPEDEQQPSLEERKRIVLSLHQAVFNFDYSGIVDPGFESARRMTHREYSNTVRDLFGMQVDLVERFPDDLTATSGFDNSANSLFVQPLLMERYLSIAEYVVDLALPKNPNTPQEIATHQRIFLRSLKSPNNVNVAATKIFRRFLLRAFRRPPTKSEVERYVNRIARAVDEGADFETAVKANLQTVLISPSFLLIAEGANASTTDSYSINDWELASRLSYFIWASMPDDELLKLASIGRLTDDSTLRAQVERMVKDRKADALGSVFAAQWLGSQHLGVRMRLDPINSPWCTESLMKAMRDETSMFFNSLVRENRPITELINADYTFLNEELAKLYRIKGVQGERMRRVKLGKSSQRGGIFGQGSLLATTSFPGRTSPVVRGKWILGTVLGTPPPPPPPNVSELSDDIENGSRLSFREKLELHRQKPNCYACHSSMDPLGLSLEQYDYFGRYRTRRGRKRIDVTGELPNGTQFEGLPGLKRVIVEQRRDDLVRQVSQKMLSYALGRQLEYYDEPAIRKIVERIGTDGDDMQTLVHEIVMSFPFRYKQNRPALNASEQ